MRRAILLLALTLAACGSHGPSAPSAATQDDRQQTVAQLKAAWQLWQAGGLASYRYTYRRSCFCIPRGPVVVTVRANRLDSVVDAETGQPVPSDSLYLYGTIESLFAQLSSAVMQDAWFIQASYDERLGYPREAYVDASAQTADEELGFSVADLEPL